jgi:hypothetical protein
VPTIKIKTDKHTPNYCALEAVSEWMKMNYQARTHYAEREIIVESGRKLKVKELAHEKGMSICSCSFKVTRVEI